MDRTISLFFRVTTHTIIAASESTTPRTRSNAAILYALALAATLVVAAVLRYRGLSTQGLLYWDSAKFALEGIRFEHILQALAGHGDPNWGKPVGTAKPGHALLIGITYLLLGVHDYAPLYLNATASLLTVVLVWLLARRLFGLTVGLVATVLFAVSGYEIVYAHAALSESDSAFFVVAGATLWLWRREDTRFQVASALVLGMAFTVNYRAILYIAALVGIDLLREWTQHGFVSAVRRGFGWLPLLAAPLLWQAVDIIARHHGMALFFSEITHRPTSYLAEALYQIHQGKQAVVHIDPIVYLAWYGIRQGLVACILFALGLILVVRQRTFPLLAVSGLVLIPYVTYSFAPFIVPRNLEIAIPFAAIVEAYALVYLVKRLPRPRVAFPSLLIGAGLVGAILAWPITDIHSGFRAAAAYIDRHGGRALSSTEVMAFYLRTPTGCRALALSLQLPTLAVEVHASYRYAVLDPHHVTTVSSYIQRHARLAAQFPQYGGAPLHETLVGSENGEYPHAASEYIQIYDLKGMPLPPPHGKIGVCQLYRPL